MTKRMLIDDTHSEETRVVVIDGNKLEDVEFESSSRKQIKGNVYLAKVMRIEPSLQAAFVDYGGNKHGFLAFGEIHPDYYNVSKKEIEEIEKEVDEIIESKKQSIKDRERQREERAQAYAAKEAKAQEEKQTSIEEKSQAENNEAFEKEAEGFAENKQEEDITAVEEKANNRRRRYPRRNQKNRNAHTKAETTEAPQVSEVKEISEPKPEAVQTKDEEIQPSVEEAQKKNASKRLLKKTSGGKNKTNKELKVLSENTGTKEDVISENIKISFADDSDIDDDIDDDDEQEFNFDMQRKLLISRKLYHSSKIQEVIKEGQSILVQVVKEERGNKGAALTTYLSLAGRYCVLMPNRIKSGGVSRKITNTADRKRLKSVLKELPLNSDMSMIVRTAGEDKSKQEITRDYNYLIRSWNQIKIDALKGKAPALIYEEANLIKRALRDMYTKDISEVIVDGASAYKLAKDFIKILSPQSLKKIKTCRDNDIPLFQRFQVEGQIEKLHDTTVQLDSGGYLVINPTEALVAIDVNSGRATKEKDLEETALKTNLEAADEIARQLRLRNLAGLIVIDFIDMEDNSNNNAVEKRMKEALKKDRSRVQVGKMSCFGLIEISRQRMHPSFFETSYEVCPHCLGKGIIRTTESCVVTILREIESEGIKNRYSCVNVFVPTNVAIYLLNQKREALCALENKYNMTIIISADESVKNISNFRIERTKSQKGKDDVSSPKENQTYFSEQETEEDNYWEENSAQSNDNGSNNHNHRRNNRYDRRKKFDRRNENGNGNGNNSYNNGYRNKNSEMRDNSKKEAGKKEKSSWWKKLIGG